jgi:synaptic vesicle membrane protein VAT-1
MREMVMARHGAPDVFEIVQRADPEPAQGEVRIRVKAAGVGYPDVLTRVGLVPGAPKPPLVPGHEVSGYIDAIGPGPSRHDVGQNVVALTRYGGYADVVTVPGDFAFAAPVNLSHNEAAAIPMSYLTALLALYRMANLKAGEVVLIHNAGGGVGLAATQLAHLRRAVVIGTASPAKHNALRSLGVDLVADYRTDELEALITRVTHGRGVDVVLDPIGGESLVHSYRMLAPLGRLIAYGLQDAASGERRNVVRTLASHWNAPRFNPQAMISDNRGVFGLDVFHLWSERRLIHASMEVLLTDFAAGRLKAVVAKSFPLGRAADAHRFLQDRANVGKVVLTC